MTIKDALLETITRDGVRWLDPAHPAYADTLAAADELAKDGKLTRKGNKLEKVTK